MKIYNKENEFAKVKSLSSDFSWFSPILADRLRDSIADSVCVPEGLSELLDVVSSCAKSRTPITIRGGGTGNYGQAVPLNGGVVIDMKNFNKIKSSDSSADHVIAESGARLIDIERHANYRGLEMRWLPSTFRSATLGGLVAGGFGGIGSINYGAVGSFSSIRNAYIISVEESPRKILVERSDEIEGMLHAYGTSCIIVSVEILLATKYSWGEYVAEFDDFDTAYIFGKQIATDSTIIKREVAVFGEGFHGFFPRIRDASEGEEKSVVVLSFCPEDFPRVEKYCEMFNGSFIYRNDKVEISAGSVSMLEYCWNHSTLHAKKYDKGNTYLQTVYSNELDTEQLSYIKSSLGDEIMQHCEFIKSRDGDIMSVGLPVIKYSSEKRLQEIIDLHKDAGIVINNPHVYTLNDGKHNGHIPRAISKLRSSMDPYGLLNPGKIRCDLAV